MPTDDAVESLIETVRLRFEALKARAEQVRPDHRVGCAFGLALPAIGLALFVLPFPWPFKLGGLVVGVASAAFGVPRLIRFGGQASALQAPFAEQVLRPFADLLVPGSLPLRETAPMADWQRSHLLYYGFPGSHESVRLVGTIASLPATLDEISWVAPHRSEWSFEGWLVRFELPFAVAGHLRVRWRSWEQRLTTESFEPVASATGRLTEPDKVVERGPGSGDAGPGLDPVTLLSDELLARIDADPDVQVGMAGRDLWLVLRNAHQTFPRQVVNFELDHFREAARRFVQAEGIARLVVAAGTSAR